MPPDDLQPLTEADVCQQLGGCSEKTLSRMVADGDFPPGFPAGRGLGRRWYQRDVDAYLWLQMRLANGPPLKKRGKSGGKICPPQEGQDQDNEGTTEGQRRTPPR